VRSVSGRARIAIRIVITPSGNVDAEQPAPLRHGQHRRSDGGTEGGTGGDDERVDARARPKVALRVSEAHQAALTLMMPAAPRPWMTRAILRVSRVGAHAQASEASVKTASPVWETRR